MMPPSEPNVLTKEPKKTNPQFTKDNGKDSTEKETEPSNTPLEPNTLDKF